MVAIAELIPTSSPFMLTRAPPELRVDRRVGLDGIEHRVLVLRVTACGDPGVQCAVVEVVTVPSSPSGDPMATTS